MALRFLFALLFFINVGANSLIFGQNDEKLRQLADKLAHHYIILDGHVDLPYRLVDQGYLGIKPDSTIVRTDDGNFDYERAKKGGLSAPFMSIYVPSSYQKTGGAKTFADSLIDLVQRIPAAYPEKFALADSPDAVRENFKKGLISLPMGMENGAPVENDVQNVNYFFNRHIRYITLTHGKDNLICDSSYDTTHTWKGVSPFGETVIAAMNDVGIMIDVSHLSDDAFYDVMKLSKAPCIASHSGCRYFTPGWERNMSDDMIRLLAKNDGVIQVNFGSTFLDSTVAKANHANDDIFRKILKEKNLKADDPEAKKLETEFKKTHPNVYSTVEKVADHIDHVVGLVGIDHVGIGSDFDGVGDSLPTGLKDVSQYPNLIYELLKRGYSKKDIGKILSGNVLRVWDAVEEEAGR